MKVNLWMKHPEIIALTTTRDGGISKDEYESLNLGLNTNDEYDSIINNRQILLNNLGLERQQLVLMNQTHSCNVKKVSYVDGGKGFYNFKDGINNCDAIYTFDKELALGVTTADCLPILIFSSKDNFIMAIHAGWQGSIDLITYKSLTYVLKEENIKVENLSIYMGPAIQKESLEIKEDIIEKFNNIGLDFNVCLHQKDGKTFLDLPLLNKMQLGLCGVKGSQIDDCKINTFTDADYFSYRKNNNCGRHLSLIMIK